MTKLHKIKRICGLPLLKIYKVQKQKDEYIKIRFIYRFCNIPIFTRSEKISYSKKIADYYLGYYKSINMTYPLMVLGDYRDAPMVLNIGEYIAKEPDILSKIQNLIKGVAPIQARNILKVISRLRQNYLDSNYVIATTQDELESLRKIAFDFKANIFEISKDVYVYDGYFLPTNSFGASVFFYKHSMDMFESSTLQKLRNKDIIDAGGYIGDSAILLEREFCDKKIHSFEATQTNFNLMLKTLKLNHSNRVIPINKGLGSKFEKLEISFIGGGSTMNKDAKNLWDFTHTDSRNYHFRFLCGAK
ncbi:hypothetical protein [Helicobacter saguini]|uniref:hypothetical protein n=1 Tax=Helicobacter saguini TaxID=1548018 RepID=UPI000A64A551|nr:hypothetical protein [Helicobacter saguini]